MTAPGPASPRFSLRTAMFFQFAVGGSVVPFITLWFRDRGLDYGQISHIYSAASASLLVCPLVWGFLSDRFIPLNRLFTLLNLAVAGSLFGIFSGSSFAGWLLAFTLFYACFHPTLTLINALSFHHLAKPREEFAGLRAWGSLGWILPSLPISLWIASSPNVRLDVVLWVGMGFAAAMVATSGFLPHTQPGAAPSLTPGAGSLAYADALRRLLRNRDYVALLAAFFLVSGAFAILMFYSAPFLEQHGVSRTWIGPVQNIGVVLEVVLFRRLSGILRRIGFTRSLLLGCGCLVARHLLFSWVDNLWVLSGSYLLAGMTIVFFHIPCSMLVNTLAGPEVRATAQTLLVILGSGLGPVCANLVSGKLAERAGQDLRPVFLFAAILAGVAGLVVFTRRRSLERAGVA